MFELGKKDEIFGVDLLKPVEFRFDERNLEGRPLKMPRLPDGDSLVAGYDQGLGERMIVCEDLKDAQQLYDAYARGGALNLTWYSGPDPGFIGIVDGSKPDIK